MRRCLVVATPTLGGERLHDEIRRLVRDGPCRFHVVVPVPSGAERAAAEQRLDTLLRRVHAMGILATGELHDGDPEVSVADALAGSHFDEVILPPLPV